MGRPTVIIADDNKLAVHGLCRVLEDEFELLCTVENGRDLVAKALEANPDVVLTELSLPLLGGIEACRQLRQANLAMKIVIITAHSNAEIVREVFRAGASGYLLDRCCAAELTAAVHSVLRGSPYITPHVTKDVVSALCGSPVFSMEVVKLTRRQREILRLVAEGHTTKQMGRILEISPRTAEFHKAALSSALGLHTTAELTRYAIEHGLSLPVPDVPAAEDAR